MPAYNNAVLITPVKSFKLQDHGERVCVRLREKEKEESGGEGIHGREREREGERGREKERDERYRKIVREKRRKKE